MKNLHIVRHSKSSWELNVSDLDRPLLEKGIVNSYVVAERLKRRFPKPELILSSPASRAIHTALIFSRCLGVAESNIQINNIIYIADCNELFALISDTPDYVDNLMLFGHNNTLTDFSNMFLNDPIDNLPTTGVASITFDTNNWNIRDVAPIETSVDFPKNDKYTF